MKKLGILFGTVLILIVLLSACGGQPRSIGSVEKKVDVKGTLSASDPFLASYSAQMMPKQGKNMDQSGGWSAFEVAHSIGLICVPIGMNTVYARFYAASGYHWTLEGSEVCLHKD